MDLGKRPDLRRCNFGAFLRMAEEHRFSEADARNVWMRLVEAVRGSRYNVTNAAQESLTYGQIVSVIEGGPEQFRGMSEARWNLARRVAARLREVLPSRTGDVVRTYEELRQFLVGQDERQEIATRLWTILIRDGLGLGLIFNDAEKRLFGVPESIILMMAEGDTDLHRNLGPTLVKHLQNWSRTF